ncbi:MAG TPA: hypothetical protein VGM03_22840 [Phycisphaerae bacterium]|jgi:hypothetical protein
MARRNKTKFEIDRNRSAPSAPSGTARQAQVPARERELEDRPARTVAWKGEAPAEPLLETGLEETPGAADASAGPGTGYREPIDADLDERQGRPGVPPASADGDWTNSDTRSDRSGTSDDPVTEMGFEPEPPAAGYGTVVSRGPQRSIHEMPPEPADEK